ncbi:hypothetical protein [Egicoccus sp. AB-alg2]|uniref:hypothetical protein n=1 Tax=Egicoccus sp. AB-alg2 TaxID=3242693 RepID=UPI00359DFD42
MQNLLEIALRRAFLYEDPSAYEAGVRDAFELLAQAGPARAPEGSEGSVEDGEVRGAA